MHEFLETFTNCSKMSRKLRSWGGYFPPLILLRDFSSFDVMLLHLKLYNNYASRVLTQNNNITTIILWLNNLQLFSSSYIIEKFFQVFIWCFFKVCFICHSLLVTEFCQIYRQWLSTQQSAFYCWVKEY